MLDPQMKTKILRLILAASVWTTRQCTQDRSVIRPSIIMPVMPESRELHNLALYTKPLGVMYSWVCLSQTEQSSTLSGVCWQRGFMCLVFVFWFTPSFVLPKKWFSSKCKFDYELKKTIQIQGNVKYLHGSALTITLTFKILICICKGCI